jgi:4-alpha-glucanotransferase
MDSSDVWSHPELFYLDDSGNPTVVAGVPPDYFSPTGQLWGNPIYRWPKHQEQDFHWWIERIRSTLKLCDLIRLDHFRGFSGYWEIPAGNPTAEIGRWVECPGDAFLQKIQSVFGYLPIIAEDLGEISKDVLDLRLKYGLPGMKILQFGFDGAANDAFLPSNYEQNFAAYTGTHDNETFKGWFENARPEARNFAMRYLNSNGEHIAWDAIRAVWQSVAVFSIAPLQDFLELGDEARMNFPGRMFGNWGFRYISSDLTPDLAFRILDLNRTYNRIPSISQFSFVPVELHYEKP